MPPRLAKAWGHKRQSRIWVNPSRTMTEPHNSTLIFNGSKVNSEFIMSKFVDVLIDGYAFRVRPSSIVAYMFEKDKSVFVYFKKKINGLPCGWLKKADDVILLDSGV